MRTSLLALCVTLISFVSLMPTPTTACFYVVNVACAANGGNCGYEVDGGCQEDRRRLLSFNETDSSFVETDSFGNRRLLQDPPVCHNSLTGSTVNWYDCCTTAEGDEDCN